MTTPPRPQFKELLQVLLSRFPTSCNGPAKSLFLLIMYHYADNYDLDNDLLEHLLPSTLAFTPLEYCNFVAIC